MSLIASVNSRILASPLSWLREWLPDGRVEQHEYVARNPRRADGKHGSFKVNLNSFVWRDFALNEKGGNDPVSLYAYVKNLPMGQAAKELAEKLGDAQPPKSGIEKPKAGIEGKCITPIPADAPSLPKALAPKHWVYRDLDGAVLGYIERYDVVRDGKPGKDFKPWTIWRDDKGVLEWRRKIWPEPRPLYGLELLGKHPSGAVLIVEGEKACDAARKICDFAVVVSWPGGANAVDRIDWNPLAGRAVAIWPDNDGPGVEAAERIARILDGKTKYTKLVQPPATKPKGWDLADAVDDGWQREELRWHISTYAEVFEAKVESSPEPKVEEIQPEVEPEIETPASEEILEAVPMAEAPPPIPTTERFKKSLNGWPIMGPKGPKGTIENWMYLIEHLGIRVRYNLIAKDQEILIPGKSFSIDNRANAAYAWLVSEGTRLGLPTTKLTDYLCALADANQFNPVKIWIESKPWDGKSRLSDLYNTVQAYGEHEDPSIKELKETLIKRWLISAVAAAFRPDGISAHGVLVFQGAQYIGKTHWFKRLVPAELGVVLDGMMLDPKDKDSVKQVCSRWLVELGELDATFRKADLAQLKAFLTKDKDVLRLPFAKKESEFARRTVFFASVNPKQFLHDDTGNRRFWTIECDSIDHRHSIDMQQLWAEVRELYLKGETWMLEPEEMAMLNEHNKSFEVSDPLEEKIRASLAWKSGKNTWTWKTATAILAAVGVDRPSRADLSKANHIIRQLNGGQYKKSEGQRVLMCPPLVASSVAPHPLYQD